LHKEGQSSTFINLDLELQLIKSKKVIKYFAKTSNLYLLLLILGN